MKPSHLTSLSELAAIQPLEVARLIAFSDAVARARNIVAMVADHGAILHDDSNASAGLWQTLNQLESDLTIVAQDLAAMALEVRSHGRAQATRTGS